MAYFYFVDKQLFRMAADDAEKTKITSFIQNMNAVEKNVTDAQFLKAEEETHVYTLDDSNDLVETAATTGTTADDQAEAVPPRLDILVDETGFREAVNCYIERIDQYLANNEDSTWSNFRSALNSFTIPTSGYPKSGSLVKLLRDAGMTAYHILRLP
jgi:hypothetical protein